MLAAVASLPLASCSDGDGAAPDRDRDRVERATERSGTSAGEAADAGDGADGASGGGAPVAGTGSTTTTTMPPRAQPVRLGPSAPGQLLGTVIVVDPGHNGLNSRYVDVRRPGGPEAEGPLCNTAGSSTPGGLDEVDVNFEVGIRLTTVLRGMGAEVILTHPDAEGFGPCADERGIVAREAGATALVSIHADGNEDGGSGFHVISAADRSDFPPGTAAESARLAAAVRDELLFVGGRTSNYTGRRGLVVRDDLANLNQARRPAVLVELGNLRNPLDATMLSSDVSYLIIARALARALVRHVGRTPDDPDVAADIGGDGVPELLAGAPQLATTTTTTTAVPAPDAVPTVPPGAVPAPTGP